MFTPVSDARSSYVNLGGSIPDTGIFSGAYDDEVKGAMVDFNNLGLTTVVTPILTTRIHKDHPKEQIIEDSLSEPQTRRMTKTFQEHAMVLQRDYVADILKKFDFSLVKKASAPIETNKALLKDEEAEDVDDHLYRSMIGSFMYLIASSDELGVKTGKLVLLSKINPTVYTSCIEQFWATANVKNVNGEAQIQALVNKKKVIITEASIRRDLRRNAIFVISSHTKKVFANMKRERKDFSRKVAPLYATMMVQAPKDIGEDLELPNDSHHIPIVTQPSSSIPQKKQKSRRKQRKEIEVPSPSSEIPNEEGASINEEDIFRVNDLDGDEVVVDVLASEKVEQSEKVVEKEVSIADPVTTAGEVVTTAAKPKAITTAATIVTAIGTRRKEKGIVMQEPSETPSPKPIISSQKSSQAKDKGKGKMVEPKRPLKRKDQIMIDEEFARNLEAQMQAELKEE
nr:hypothetical protein [Tanacetum cinerariifolium]